VRRAPVVGRGSVLGAGSPDRLSAIPEAYWGTWVPTAEICEDADKSAIVLSAKAYVASAVSCTVDYVAETPSPNGKPVAGFGRCL
jgi:hypothetical protein